MSLINQRWDNLSGGISQAPDTHKFPGQFTDLRNTYIYKNKGLGKRPPAQTGFRALQDQFTEEAHLEVLNFSENERFVVEIVNGDLRVFDALNGGEQQVDFPDGKSYLQATTQPSWRACTVGDTTFLVNREKEVIRQFWSPPFNIPYTVILELDTKVSSLYRVYIPGHVEVNVYPGGAIRTTEDVTGNILSSYKNSIPKDNAEEHLEIVAGIIRKELKYHLRGWDVRGVGRYISIENPTKTRFEISQSNLRLIEGSVKSVEELPNWAPPDTYMRVAGMPGEDVDDLWVISEDPPQEDREAGYKVIWRETTRPGVISSLAHETMPHVLVRDAAYVENIRINADSADFGPAGHKWLYSYPLSIGFDQDDNGAFIYDPNQGDFMTDNGQTAVALIYQEHNNWAPSMNLTVNWGINLAGIDSIYNAQVKVRLVDGVTRDVLREEVRSYRGGTVAMEESWRLEDLRPDRDYGVGSEPLVYIILIHNVPLDETIPLPKVLLYGTDSEVPAIQSEYAEWSFYYLGKPSNFLPMNLRFSIRFDHGGWLWTNTKDDYLPDAVLRLITFYETIAGSGDVHEAEPWEEDNLYGMRCKRNGNPHHNGSIDYILLPSNVMWSKKLDLTPGSLVGKRVVNRTTGWEGTVTSNSRHTITVNENNKVKTGDEISVYGVGGGWTFKQVPWGGRLVGDYESSPWPSFVDKKISDVFYHRGRLGFISDGNVIMSAVGDLYRFFRHTVTQVLDDDPIDVFVSSRKAARLDTALEWNGMLLLFTKDGEQYSVSGSPVLSPNTVSIEHLSSYPVSLRCRPLVLGGSLMLPDMKNRLTTFRDYFESVYGRLSSQVITDHVPELIQGEVVSMAGDPDLGVMAVLTDYDNKIYIWQYRKTDVETVMSAWHVWEFPTASTVKKLDVYKGQLLVIGEYYHGDQYLLGANTVELNSEMYVSSTWRDELSTPYDSYIKVPTFYLRTDEGSPQVHGRTQIRYLRVEYSDTIELNAFVTGLGGSREALKPVGSPYSGILLVPVMGENEQTTIEIRGGYNGNTFCLTGMDWEVFHHTRGRR